jgi:thymidylate kinase
MFSCALIGPDGSGKTSVCRSLEQELPLPVKYVYMGVSPDSSNHMLPTTRLIRWAKRVAGGRPDTHGPRDHAEIPRPRGSLPKRLLRSARAGIALFNRIGEEWFRQLLAWYYQLRGHVVLFDRHFFPDYFAYDIAAGGRGRPLTRRLHGFMLQHLFPRPDLVIYLDAPAEVLFARKGEGTLEVLERRRQDYLMLRDVIEDFVVVDATQPQDRVVREVAERLLEFHRTRCADRAEVQHVKR